MIISEALMKRIKESRPGDLPYAITFSKMHSWANTGTLAAFVSSSRAANVMVAIDEKKTNSVEMYCPLCQFIAFNYSEREAQNLEDDLQAVKQMRSDLECPFDSLDVRCYLL
ncbi:hypothetical protein NE237_022767 [Protea cynaroides]|uniref:Uncharacterized protein n=1 Tax=Protea cynaroides TaxID=273540 RepID=A0A9Q0HDP4_9MAGN|nr:hypothetical protein NE237_022767 [Protea cynaroides]